MSDFAFLASQKSSFSTGFIRFFDMAECHVVHSEKPNAFLIISGAILRFGLQNEQNSTGFIRYFDQLFSMLQNGLGPMLFLTFRKVAKRLRLLVENLMLF